MKLRTATQGFSLIELSMVLAIIGLLVGGVMGGQALIERSRLIGITNDLGKYRTAYNKFRKQYAALPGDFVDATEYWGSDTGTACSTSPVAGDRVLKVATCNGNGNDHIADMQGTVDSHEIFRAWQHLSNAGYIQGSFSGVTGAGALYDATLELNVPRGPLDGTGYSMLYYYPITTGTVSLFVSEYGNLMIYGKDMTNHYTYGPALTPAQAVNIDTKIDDGMPGLGRVMTYPSGTNSGCTTSDTYTSASYSLTTLGEVCSFIFLLN